MKPLTTTAPASADLPAIASELPPLHLSSPALRIMLDDRLFERCKLMAKYMSSAEGFMPRHLIGNQEACFAVVNRALAWNLDPFAVAACTYQTPNGRVGFEGKLISAVLSATGRLVGPVRHRHFGDWAKIQGRFKKARSQKGHEYAAPDWKPEDEIGLGVEISATVRGEAEPRTLSLLLVQAYPRNSTLWALDPMTQIVYLATRRFANLAAPDLVMGLPFDGEVVAGDGAMDVTNSAGDPPPRPKRDDFGGAKKAGKPAAPAASAEDEDAAENVEQGDAVDDEAAAGGSPPVPAADPRAAMSAAELERVEREADAIQRAAERGETPAAEDAAPAIRPIPVQVRKDGTPDWLKWHSAVATAVSGLIGEDRQAFRIAIGPALENYANASPQNAAALRILLEREAD